MSAPNDPPPGTRADLPLAHRPPRRRKHVLARAIGRSPFVHRRHFRVHSARIPDGTPTLRIAHLSDLHVGRMTPEARLVAAVLAANDFEPDVVCLTGDYIAHSLRYLDRLAHALAQLEAPVLATMGNHDHWQDARAVGRALEKAGVDVLWNESRRMEVAGASWQIVGLDDAVTANHDVERAFRDVGEGPTVVLSHLAEVAPECDPKGSGLMLSGHTHGGQVQVGKVTHHVLRRMGHDYVDGWYTSGETAIYVNRGIGASVFPFRNKHARAEVAGIELSPHNGSDAPVEIEETREDAPWGPDGPA